MRKGGLALKSLVGFVQKKSLISISRFFDYLNHSPTMRVRLMPARKHVTFDASVTAGEFNNEMKGIFAVDTEIESTRALRMEVRRNLRRLREIRVAPECLAFAEAYVRKVNSSHIFTARGRDEVDNMRRAMAVVREMM